MPVDGEKGVMVFMNVLNIEHVSKIFGDKKIFDDISYGIMMGIKSESLESMELEKVLC